MRVLTPGLAGLTSQAGHKPSPPLSAEPTAISTNQAGATPPPTGSASWNSSAGNTTS
ncbi:hypothetical protein [Streptomyces cyaneus]|uniref:hypothetical protein n=1 Tax=Streptomyces cyaneus TaxID=1904 RepID=UPI0013E3A435|nr:hypothetical protein [Streptomyces cyaneus]